MWTLADKRDSRGAIDGDETTSARREVTADTPCKPLKQAMKTVVSLGQLNELRRSLKPGDEASGARPGYDAVGCPA